MGRRKKPIDASANAQVELLIACLRSLKVEGDYSTVEVRLGKVSQGVVEALVVRGGALDHTSVLLKSEYSDCARAIDNYALTIERPSGYGPASGYQPSPVATISAYVIREATAEELAAERERLTRAGT